jgi:glucose/arabinose dehydrogenase
MAAGPDGKIYFGQGTMTNAGVVGPDNFLPFGWLMKYPDLHDVPARDLKLRDLTFEEPDPIAFVTRKEYRKVKTSAFQPFGTTATTAKGAVKANGTILRMNPDGSGLEVYAWGLRNPFGLLWTPDGKLLATDAGYDERGSRPIARAPDCLWAIKQGAWYGFPDFAGGDPVTDPKFRSSRGPAPQFLLAEHPPVEKPLLALPPHTGATKLAASPGGAFGRGQIYAAVAGNMIPASGAPNQHPAPGVARIDGTTLHITPFFGVRPEALGPPGMEPVVTAGPRRPVDVRFSPRGDALYIADVGGLAIVPSAIGPMPRPFPRTGVIWRIRPAR